MTITREATQITTPASRGSDAVEFHRLSRSVAGARWWRPLLVGVVALGCYAAMNVLLMLVLIPAGLAIPSLDKAIDVYVESDGMDLKAPVSFAMAMGMIILMLPAVLLATRLVGAMPVGLVSSVLGRLRWRWLARCGVVAMTIYTLAIGASFLVGAAQGESFALAPDVPRILLMLILTFVLVPFQSAAEEYVFRGYLLQAVGHYLRHPALAILLPVPLFVLGHGHEVLGQIDITVFAIAAGWLTCRTGGLEAAIALHVVGNVYGLALGALGLVDVNATDQTLPGLLVSVLMTVVFVMVILRLAKNHSIQRRRPSFARSSLEVVAHSEETTSPLS